MAPAMDDDARPVIRALISVIEEAQAMAKAGAVGAVPDETMQHAQELLDIIDCELLQL